MPMKFIISETDEILVSHSGLGLAGALLQGTGIQKRSSAIRLGDRKRPEVSHGDVLTAMIALLCLGKPDFGAIEAFRQDEFFRRALGLKKVPSEGTLRQRLDELEHRCDAILREESAAMVARHAPMCDLEGHVTFASRRVLQMYGMENVEEVLGRNPLEFFAPEDQQSSLQVSRGLWTRVSRWTSNILS